MVTEITKYSCCASCEKLVERFPDFEIQESQELKGNSENQDTKKSTPNWLNVWTSWAENKNFETNLLAHEVKELDKKLQKFFTLHEFLRL